VDLTLFPFTNCSARPKLTMPTWEDQSWVAWLNWVSFGLFDAVLAGIVIVFFR
jgi:hypothetical protein